MELAEVEEDEPEDDVPPDDDEETEIPVDEVHVPVAPAAAKAVWMADAERSPFAEQEPA